MGRIIANQEQIIGWIGFVEAAALKELDAIATLEFHKLKETTFEDARLPRFSSRKKFYFQLSDSRLFEADTAEEAIIESQISNEPVVTMTLLIQEGIINSSLFIYHQPNLTSPFFIKIKCEPQDNEHAARIFNQLLYWSKKQIAPKQVFVMKEFAPMVAGFSAFGTFFMLMVEVGNYIQKQYIATGFFYCSIY